ncbi:Cof-type HAD-IIB family hydrolase [Carnobacterium gallinarum]|uniref:Cof-type HAD-IIB family hydrolase n=1 Tax=Carnobacterium gallinarum TaxID=2749 RepID=UPI0005528B74|nr:Cof-type HAD-IIB family hydrolase [Carnobacterium gallinarum]
MYKIVFFDIDGTLLDSKRQIPPSAKEAIAQLKEQGIIPAIATGRPPFRIKEIIDELGIDTHISLNGQYVVHKNEVIYQNSMKPSIVKHLAQAAEKNQQTIDFAGAEKILGNSSMALSPNGWQKRLTQGLPFAPPHFLVNLFVKYSGKSKKKHPILKEYYEERVIYQCMLHASEEFDQYYSQEFPSCNFMRWNPHSVDVCPDNGSKAIGIVKLLELLHIPIEQSAAFGDGLNDIDMLKIVGTGIAMENGRDELKAVANLITDKPEDDGILHGLQKLNILE